QIFNLHPSRQRKNFDHFVQVQLLWDEGMAQQVADYLRRHPDRKMVVLAGFGHVAHGVGIPNRVERRLPVDSAIVLPGDRTQIQPGIGDFILFPQKSKLPPAGLMGVFLGESGSRGVKVEQIAPDGAAADAGVKEGDWISKIDDIEIQTRADIKIAMLGRKPDERITVQVKRKRFILGEKELELELTLGQ
ncbi:MAG: PDZ domain-containing protein, partial [Gammaproteobacteria bacterium]